MSKEEEEMNYVKLDVVINAQSPSKTAIHKAINAAGGLHHVSTDYAKAARKLSRLPWVSRVVATCVSENNVGTWRKGRKS
jgi:hypothetical protein